MTKRIFALLWAVLLMAAPGALGDDLTAQRATYFGADAIPQGEIGATIFWGFYAPDQAKPECMGIDTLLIEFARPGVTGGAGYLRVVDAADDSLFFECQGSDPDCVDFQPSEMGGTDMFITMDEPLESGGRYYLQLDEGAVVADGLSSKAIDTKATRQILVGDFGLDEMAMAEDYFVGEPAPLPVILGSMARAEIQLDAAFITASAAQITKDEVVTLTPVQAGETEVNICFYDQAGNYVNGLIVPIAVLPAS